MMFAQRIEVIDLNILSVCTQISQMDDLSTCQLLLMMTVSLIIVVIVVILDSFYITFYMQKLRAICILR